MWPASSKTSPAVVRGNGIAAGVDLGCGTNAELCGLTQTKMNNTARACAPLGYSAAADAARSAFSAVIRASLSCRALTSNTKARSIFSVERRLAAR